VSSQLQIENRRELERKIIETGNAVLALVPPSRREKAGRELSEFALIVMRVADTSHDHMFRNRLMPTLIEQLQRVSAASESRGAEFERLLAKRQRQLAGSKSAAPRALNAEKRHNDVVRDAERVHRDHVSWSKRNVAKAVKVILDDRFAEGRSSRTLALKTIYDVIRDRCQW
jgi:hypothetical protein